MRAVTWQGKRDVRVETVPDPILKEDTDAIIRVTTTGICGSDLHLYELLGPYMAEGDILGHEPMGVVQEVGAAVSGLVAGDRVVIPFQISCGSCFMCDAGLTTQCETTQVRDEGTGAALFGYSKMYGSVPGGQAEYLRVPHAQNTTIKVPEGPPDDRFVYLSDVLPTAWQAVQYADVPEGGTVAVLGLGPIGDMASRIALHQERRVIAVDLVDERLQRARRRGRRDDRPAPARRPWRGHPLDDRRTGPGLRDRRRGDGGARGSRGASFIQRAAGILPDALQEKVMDAAGIDRLARPPRGRGHRPAWRDVVDHRGLRGAADPLPMKTLFDKQIQVRMGQANVKRWVDDILPLLTDDDPLGVDDFATHRLALEEAPDAYANFQAKRDGTVKVLLRP